MKTLLLTNDDLAGLAEALLIGADGVTMGNECNQSAQTFFWHSRANLDQSKYDTFRVNFCRFLRDFPVFSGGSVDGDAAIDVIIKPYCNLQ